MIGRKDFTTPEWEDLQATVFGTIKYISKSDKSFWGDLKETIFERNKMKQYSKTINSPFIDELIDLDKFHDTFPSDVENSAEAISAWLLPKITSSVASIKQRGSNYVDQYKNLILYIAYNTADITGGIDAQENEAYINIVEALEATPQPITKEWDINNPLN